MELTIHSVERLQGRTRLTLTELREIFSNEACVPLGQAYDSYFYLFFDYRAKSFRVACIKNGPLSNAYAVLVTILKTKFTLPKNIRAALNPAARKAAKNLVQENIAKVQRAKQVKYMEAIFAVKGKTGRDELYREVLQRVGTNISVNKIHTVQCFMDRIVEIVDTSTFDFKTVEFEIFFKNMFGKVRGYKSYSPKEVVQAYHQEYEAPYIVDLVVTRGNDTHEIALGKFPYQTTHITAKQVVTAFADSMEQVISAIQANYSEETQADIRYKFVIKSSWQDIEISNVGIKLDNILDAIVETRNERVTA